MIGFYFKLQFESLILITVFIAQKNEFGPIESSLSRPIHKKLPEPQGLSDRFTDRARGYEILICEIKLRVKLPSPSSVRLAKGKNFFNIPPLLRRRPHLYG